MDCAVEWFGENWNWAMSTEQNKRDFEIRMHSLIADYGQCKSLLKLKEKRRSSIIPQNENEDSVNNENENMMKNTEDQVRKILMRHSTEEQIKILQNLLSEHVHMPSESLAAFADIKTLEKQLRHNKSMYALITKRIIYTACFRKEMKITDLENLFERNRFKNAYAQELRECREYLLAGEIDKLVDSLYDGSEWYSPEIKEILKKWFHDVRNYELNLDGKKSLVDIWGDGNKIFTQQKILKACTKEENHVNFSEDENYGKKCEKICGRIPSSEKLHEFQPRDVIFFKKMQPGVHQKKLELKLNFHSLRKFLLRHFPPAADALGDDPSQFALGRTCPFVDGITFLRCISGKCNFCTFNHFLILNMCSINMGDIVSYDRFEDGIENFSFIPLFEYPIKFNKYTTVPNVKPGGRDNATLASYYLSLEEFLLQYEPQLEAAKELLWAEKIQLRAICKSRRAQYLPDDSSSVDYDFSTLVPYVSGMYQSQAEFLNSGKFSIETFIMNIKLSPIRTLKLDGRIKKYILQFFSEDKGKDCFAHLVSFENYLDIVQEEAPATRIIYCNSDGSGGQYKNSKHFMELKEIACSRNICFLCNFCPPGLGKGEHDREGGQAQNIYCTECCREIGTDARDLGRTAEWFNEKHSEIKSPESNTEKRIFFHTPASEVQERRSMCLEVGSLFSLEHGPVTRKNFCYYISDDPEEKGLWTRKFSCLDCENCLTGIWELMKQCSNERCGEWIFIPFDFLNIEEHPWLTEEEKLDKKNLLRTLPCDCGGIITLNNFYTHSTTKRHLKYMEQMNISE